MESQYLEPPSYRRGSIHGLLPEAGSAARTSLILLMMVAASVGQEVPAAGTAPPAPTATQIPDAPSATKQARQRSFGHGVATVARTIGQDEWHLVTAPFRIDSVGFADKAPFLNKTLFLGLNGGGRNWRADCER